MPDPYGAPAQPGVHTRARTKPAMDDSAALLAMARINACLVSIGGRPNDRLAAREAVARLGLSRKTRSEAAAGRLRMKFRRSRAALMAQVEGAADVIR